MKENFGGNFEQKPVRIEDIGKADKIMGVNLDRAQKLVEDGGAVVSGEMLTTVLETIVNLTQIQRSFPKSPEIQIVLAQLIALKNRSLEAAGQEDHATRLRKDLEASLNPSQFSQ